MDDSYYDVAQICLNGHIINQSSRTLPKTNKKRCSDCGAETIVKCQVCRQPIRGDHSVPGVGGFGRLDRALAVCHEYAKPYPWTESRREAARDLADQFELDVPERAVLEKSIEEIAKDTPRAPAEAVRFKSSIVGKSQPWVLAAFKGILYGIGGEAVKKMIWLS